MRTPERWDIFCRVVDNFGDAGVCWRLARQLAREHGARVRLWIDDLASLNRLDPAVAEVDRQRVDDVQVRRWAREFPGAKPADVVIEAFGCGLPDDYVNAMASASRRPLWIVLEYLSAERWVSGHHALPSPHPRWPLERYFFFPGFVEGTGGLLREADLFQRRDAFGDKEKDAFWRSVGHVTPSSQAITVSLFAYESAPLAELFEHWEEGAQPIVAAIPEGRALPGVLNHFGAAGVPAHRVFRRGVLEARILPFVPQTRYDELLWSCDCNFVRGEDSFVRAQWAARLFVWQIYPQQDRAHWQKMESFIALYGESLPRPAWDAVARMMRSWNRIDAVEVSIASAWDAFIAQREALSRHGRVWANRVAAIGGLAEHLACFCRDKLK